MFQIESASLSDPGRKRQNNEDFIASFEPEDPDELRASGCLYIVADGVGGAIKGEKASRYATQKVLFEYYRHPELSIDERLRGSMRQSGNDIFLYAQDNHESRMATTMVAAAIRDDKLTVANVGDSRAYLIRGESVQQITHDHSLVGEMVRDGLISEADSYTSRVKNLLTRSLGGEMDVHIDIFPDIPLQTGDRILLCSDGLSRYAQRADLYSLAHQGSPDEVVKALVDFANHRGGADNTSVVLIAIGRTANGQETILPMHSKQTQSLADWENIPTLVDDFPAPKKGMSKKNKRNITWEILVIAFLLGFSGILIWLIKFANNGSVPVSLAQTETRTAAGAIMEFTSTQASSTIATSTITTTVIPQIQPTATLTPTISGDVPNNTPTVAITNSTSIPRPPICIFLASDAAKHELRPFLSVILIDIFHVTYDKNQIYYYYICNDTVDYVNCQPSHQILDNDGILAEWWIEIPGVGPTECNNDNKGGILIQPP